MSSTTTGSGGFAGTLTGDFTLNGTTLVSADITASTATVSGHTFPGFEYTYGIPGTNSTLTNGLGQAEPNFRLDSGSNELELAWVGNATPTLISAFDPNHSFESEPAGGNRFVTSGDAPDIPSQPQSPPPDRSQRSPFWLSGSSFSGHEQTGVTAARAAVCPYSTLRQAYRFSRGLSGSETHRWLRP
jgi:hypothetical protein